MKAAQGRLVPVDDVKPVGDGHAHLFEIRWGGIAVTAAEASGEVHHGTAIVRLIHAEPVHAGMSAVGLHAHEKVVFERDDTATRDNQDEHIEIATRRYFDAVATTWDGRGRLRG